MVKRSTYVRRMGSCCKHEPGASSLMGSTLPSAVPRARWERRSGAWTWLESTASDAQVRAYLCVQDWPGRCVRGAWSALSALGLFSTVCFCCSDPLPHALAPVLADQPKLGADLVPAEPENRNIQIRFTPACSTTVRVPGCAVSTSCSCGE